MCVWSVRSRAPAQLFAYLATKHRSNSPAVTTRCEARRSTRPSVRPTQNAHTAESQIRIPGLLDGIPRPGSWCHCPGRAGPPRSPESRPCLARRANRHSRGPRGSIANSFTGRSLRLIRSKSCNSPTHFNDDSKLKWQPFSPVRGLNICATRRRRQAAARSLAQHGTPAV